MTESEAIGKFYWDVFPKIGEPLSRCGSLELRHSRRTSRDEFIVGDRSYMSFGYSPGSLTDTILIPFMYCMT